MSEQNNSEIITKSKIEQAITLLKEQKPKPRESLSEKEAVRSLRRYIEKLTSSKYGYNYDEVSEMLKGLGINLSGSRIKYLIGELKKSSSRRKKISTSDDKDSSSQTVTETKPAVQASSETENSRVTSAQEQSNQQPTEPSLAPLPQPNKSVFVPKRYQDEDL